MRVFEVMTTRVKTTPSTAAAADAWDVMRAANIRHLVVKDGPAVVGIVSDTDLGGPNGSAVRAGCSVADLMQRRFASVTPDDTIRKAANLMAGRAATCVPVIRAGRLLGVVTAADLLALLGRGVDRPGHEDRAAIHYRVPHRKTPVRRTAW